MTSSGLWNYGANESSFGDSYIAPSKKPCPRAFISSRLCRQPGFNPITGFNLILRVGMLGDRNARQYTFVFLLLCLPFVGSVPVVKVPKHFSFIQRINMLPVVKNRHRFMPLDDTR